MPDPWVLTGSSRRVARRLHRRRRWSCPNPCRGRGRRIRDRDARGVRPAGAGRRRLPDRHQVADRVGQPRARPLPATVVVNAAEGEPGSFKDRAILRADPYRVLEGALVAATAVGADTVVVATKASFTDEIDAAPRRHRRSCAPPGWFDGVDVVVVEGPEEYLFGEETGAARGRRRASAVPPHRAAVPPRRRGGVGERRARPRCRWRPAGDSAADAGQQRRDPRQRRRPSSPRARTGSARRAPRRRRARSCAPSPARAERHGVGEFALGTPLREVIEPIGGPGTADGRWRSCRASPTRCCPPTGSTRPLTYEDMEAAGSGLGAAGFIVFDDSDDLAAVAHGVARFLAVESCGQCTPCKQDGLAIAERAGPHPAVRRRTDGPRAVVDRVATVADGARCYLAHQHQRVRRQRPALFPDALRRARRRHRTRGRARTSSPRSSTSKATAPCSTTGSRPSSRTGPTIRPTRGSPGRRPASTSNTAPRPPRTRTSSAEHVVVGVGAQGPLPVLEQREGPVLGDPALVVLVPAVHVGPAPRHGAVLGVDLLVEGVVHVLAARRGRGGRPAAAARGSRGCSGRRTPRSTRCCR